MRRLEVRTAIRPRGYRTPAEAMEANRKVDAAVRRIEDREVAGQVLREFWWTDAAFTARLGDGRFLNVRLAGPRSLSPVACTVDRDPLVERREENREDVILVEDGRERNARRADLGRAYRNRVLASLFHGAEGLWVGVRGMDALFFTAMACRPGRRRVLLWEESA